tara:strand:- start:85 stop:1281 length:1197 start_codon:yes stop_codon:yes gene_type:complete
MTEINLDKKGMFDYLLKEIVYVLEDNDIPYHLCCGTLLGCIREGDFISHDGDVDVATQVSYWSKLTKINWKKYNLEKIRQVGLKESGGFLMSVKTKYSGYYCDIYANPAIPLLKKKKFRNRKYFIPVSPKTYLTQLYGEEWTEPKYAEGDKYHADWPPLWYKYDSKLYSNYYSKFRDESYPLIPFGTYDEKNEKFWEQYYRNNNHDIEKESSFAKFVHDEYIKSKELTIADLGSGNCRDSKYFAQKGNNVYAVDFNGVLDNKTQHGLTLIKKDVEEFLLDEKLKFDIIYMRWFLHAMPYGTSERILKTSINNIKKGGLICIEVRSINDKEFKDSSVYDETDKSYATTHKRWPYSVERLEKIVKDSKGKIVKCEEGHFSPNKNTETSNPLLIRLIVRKN